MKVIPIILDDYNDSPVFRVWFRMDEGVKTQHAVAVIIYSRDEEYLASTGFDAHVAGGLRELLSHGGSVVGALRANGKEVGAVRIDGDSITIDLPSYTNRWRLSDSVQKEILDLFDTVGQKSGYADITHAAKVDEIVSGYLHDYEFDDGETAGHMPTEFELMLISDAVVGLLDDDAFLDALTDWRLLVRARKATAK